MRVVAFIYSTLLGEPLVQNAEGHKSVLVYDRDSSRRVSCLLFAVVVCVVVFIIFVVVVVTILLLLKLLVLPLLKVVGD